MPVIFTTSGRQKSWTSCASCWDKIVAEPRPCPHCNGTGTVPEAETTVESLRRLCGENRVHVYVGDAVNTAGAAKLVGRSPVTLGHWRGAADHNDLPFYRPNIRGPV